jgi:hypothetical protein
MASTNFHVTLHHLSPDAKTVGVAYTNEQLAEVTPAQLRVLLHALSNAAARLSLYEPATPEIRIKTERSAFVVRTRHRRLCLVGWEARLRGEEHSISHILSTVTGTAAEAAKTPTEPDRTGASGSNSPLGSGGSKSPLGTESNPPFPSAKEAESETTGGLPRWAKIAGLAALIVGFNATTIYLVFYRTGPSLAPQSTPVAEFETGALLAKAAGEYETGGLEGDRRLIIEPSGNVRVAKYGPERAILQETTRTAKGGTVKGKVMLITSDPATIELKDQDSVIYFGTTYRRRNR